MVNIDFIGLLIDSMENAVLQLEAAVLKGNNEHANKLKVFIFDLHNQIDLAMRS